MSKRFEKAKYYTEKYKSILIPCKYCGCKDIQINSDRMAFGDNKNYWYVCCLTRGCDCTGFYTSVRQAIKRWNENHDTERNGTNETLY